MVDVLLFGYDIGKVTGNMFYVVLGMIVFDILTGTLAAAKERKINSSISFDGLIRKLGIIVGLAFITFVDVYFNANGSVTKVGVALLIVYEGLSTVENFSKIGINLSFLTKFFDSEKVGKQ